MSHDPACRMRIILCAHIALYPSLTLCPVLVVFPSDGPSSSTLTGGQVREFGSAERVFRKVISAYRGFNLYVVFVRH
jgi:hypothetical protein